MKTLDWCDEPTPRRIACKTVGCRCTLIKGHKTPHRANCGARWRNKINDS